MKPTRAVGSLQRSLEALVHGGLVRDGEKVWRVSPHIFLLPTPIHRPSPPYSQEVKSRGTSQYVG